MFPRVKRSGKYEYLQIVENRRVNGQGRPVCCELWPGNTPDVTTLVLKAELFERLDQWIQSKERSGGVCQKFLDPQEVTGGGRR